MLENLTANLTFVERAIRPNLHFIARNSAHNQRLTPDSRAISRNYTFSYINGVLTEVRVVKEGVMASFLPAEWDAFSPKIRSLIDAYGELGESVKSERFRPGIPSMKIDLIEPKVLFGSYEGKSEEFSQPALTALSAQIAELKDLILTTRVSTPQAKRAKVHETYSETVARILDKNKCLTTASIKNALEVFVKEKRETQFAGKVYDVKRTSPRQIPLPQESKRLLVPLYLEGTQPGERGHFAGLLIDFKEKITYYYDSSGVPLSKRGEVSEFTQNLHERFFGKRSFKFWESHGKIVDEVKKQQNDETSCGRYLLAYYRGRIEKGADHEAFINASINTDQVINELRPIINELSGIRSEQRPPLSSTPHNKLAKLSDDLKARLTSKTEKLYNTDIEEIFKASLEQAGRKDVQIFLSTDLLRDAWTAENSRDKFKSGKILLPLRTEGGHFVAVFVDIDQKEISYYDSKGVNLKDRTDIMRSAAILKVIFDNFTFIDSVKYQQGDGVSCGRYVIDYFMKRLKGVSHEEYLLQKGLHDEEINRRMKALV